MEFSVRKGKKSINLDTLRGCKSKHNVLSKLAGLLFLLQTVLFAVFMTDVKKFLEQLVRSQAKLVPRTQFFESWSHPPLTPRLKLFLFNVTNPAAFLEGAERVSVEEVGPFTYAASRTNVVEDWSANYGSVRFKTKAKYTFLPMESIMGDDTVLTLPNTLLLSGMLNTKAKDNSDFIKKNIVWPILTSTGFTENDAFLRMSVREYIWGHENELACLSLNEGIAEDQDDDDDDFFSDNWFDSAPKTKSSLEMREPEVRNFRRKDGRCMFGTLADRNDTFGKTFEVQTGNDNVHHKGKIISVDSYRNFGGWKAGSPCDIFAGTSDPSTIAPPQNDSFDLFMDVICRSLTMKKLFDITTESGIQVTRFGASRDTFTLGNDSCYANPEMLPQGALMIRHCAQGSPMAVSFPRFLFGSPWYRNNINGLPEANTEDHLLYTDIEPWTGAPYSIQIRFQLNIVLKRDEAFQPLAKLPEGYSVVPIFWAQEGFLQPDETSVSLLKLGLALPTVLGHTLVVITFIIALICFLIPLCTHHLKGQRPASRNLVFKDNQKDFSVPLKTYYLKVPKDEIRLFHEKS